MNHTFYLLFIIFLPTLSFSQSEEGTTFRLFYLGGQSNMDGYGYNKDLPAELKKTFDDVWIFHGNPAPDEAEWGSGRR